jgi:hypothetical protein
MVGSELVCFKYIEKTQDNLYKISHLTRGIMGTEQYITAHASEENFILLNSDMSIIPISEKLQNQSIDFKCCAYETSIIYQNKVQQPLPPYITKQELLAKTLFLIWVPREKDDGNWQFLSTPKSYQFTITVSAGEQSIIITTDLCEIAIDIQSLDISAGYKIAIITIVS